MACVWHLPLQFWWVLCSLTLLALPLVVWDFTRKVRCRRQLKAQLRVQGGLGWSWCKEHVQPLAHIVWGCLHERSMHHAGMPWTCRNVCCEHYGVRLLILLVGFSTCHWRMTEMHSPLCKC